MAIIFDTEVARAPKHPTRRHNARERKVLETVQQKLTEDLLQHSFVQCEIDFATSGNRTMADHSTGINLPANALVVRVFQKVTVNLTSASNGATVALYIGASSDGKQITKNLTAGAGNETSGFVEVVADSTFIPDVQVNGTSASALTVKIGSEAITNTSGKVQYIVEYIIPA